MCALLQLLYNQPTSRCVVTFARLPPASAAKPPWLNRKLTFHFVLFKTSSLTQGHSQHVALAAFAFSPPRPTARTACACHVFLASHKHLVTQQGEAAGMLDKKLNVFLWEKRHSCLNEWLISACHKLCRADCHFSRRKFGFVVWTSTKLSGFSGSLDVSFKLESRM